MRNLLFSIVLFLPTAGLIAGLAAAQGDDAFAKNLFSKPDAPPAFSAAPIAKLTPVPLDEMEFLCGDDGDTAEDNASSPRTSAPAPDPDSSSYLLNLIAEPIKTLPNPPITCYKRESTEDCAKNKHQRDPINLIIIGSKKSVSRAFRKIRWAAMTTNFPKSMLLWMPLELVMGLPRTPSMERQWIQFQDQNKPKRQDLNRAKGWPFIRVARRDHSRQWILPVPTSDHRLVYAGAATFDTRPKLGGGHLFSHAINPDIDHERDKFLDRLQRKNLVKNFTYVTLKGAVVIKRPGPGEKTRHHFTDGRTLVIELQ